MGHAGQSGITAIQLPQSAELRINIVIKKLFYYSNAMEDKKI